MLFWGVSEKHGISVSVNDFVIRAAALALKEVPEANGNALNSGLCFWKGEWRICLFSCSSQQSMMVACAAFWDDNAGDRVANKSIDICVAVATDKVNIINASSLPTPCSFTSL